MSAETRRALPFIGSAPSVALQNVALNEMSEAQLLQLSHVLFQAVHLLLVK